MRPVRLVMMCAVLVTALFSAATLSGQSNPASAAQATGAATVAPTTAGGAVTAAATTAATSGAVTGGGATAVPPTASLTATRPAGRATAGPRPVVFGPCPNPNIAAPAPTATLARTPTTIPAIDMGTGVTVVTDARTGPVTQAGQFDVVTQILELQPGAVTVAHVHTGSVVVVVMEGEVTNCTATTQQVFTAGQSWTERPNAVGAIANTGSAVARLAMIMLTPRTLPPMVVVPVITATPGGTR